MILDLFLADGNIGIVFYAPAVRFIFGTWIYNRIFKKNHPLETYFCTGGAKVTNTNFLTLLLTAAVVWENIFFLNASALCQSATFTANLSTW